MQKDNMNLKDYIISQKKKKYKIIFVLVIIAAVFVCVILGFTIFGSKVESIYKAYAVLSNRPFNSRSQFPDPFEAIRKNGNDGYSIEFGLASDYGDGSRSGPSDSDPGTGDGNDDGDGGGNSNPNDPNDPGDPNDPTIEPISGPTITYPQPESEKFKVTVINTKLSYDVVRTHSDFFSTETSYGYMEQLSSIIAKRVHSLDSNITNKNKAEPLKAVINGETYYIGAMVDGFAAPGDIIETKFNNGQSLKMIIVDVKSLNDAKGTGAKDQFDSSYGHGTYLGNGKCNLNVLEFITGGTNSKKANLSSIPGYGSYAISSTKISHINL